MKRFSAATVAAATALTLTVAPAYAQDAENTGAENTDTNTAATAPEESKDEKKPAEESKDEEKPGQTEKPGNTEGDKNKNDNNQQPGAAKQTSGSSQGHLIAAFSGTLAAVLTTSLIVFSDPRGINKIIDALNREFHLGIPHVNVPQVQLPNLPF